jgi:hypothetical protein
VITRGSLRGAQNLYEGHKQRYEQWNDVFRQKSHEGAGVAPEAGSRSDTRLNRVEVQPWGLAGERHRRGESALLI